MSFRGYMLLAAGLVFGGALFSQAVQTGLTQDNDPTQETGPVPKMVDVRAENFHFDKELNTSLGIDENATILVGDVAFHHNGAVIACDSAVRYSDNRIECFKNVIINKDSTFVYGDKAVYDGGANLARVWSGVIKVIDGDATLYTYNFVFNTSTNVGKWSGGGVMYQKDNVMESEVGYMYSDLNELVAVRGVEMRNSTHKIISDSVTYNTDTEMASFFTKTYIWTDKGEIITADAGRYNSRDSTYFFWDDAYILDEFRETWADTIDFAARPRDAIMYGNIQIDDDEHESSAFGDYGRYWGERGETMLTRLPALLNYDDDQTGGDTMYMRADTVFMFVRYPSDRRAAEDSVGDGRGATVDPHAHLRRFDSLPDSVKVTMADSLVPVIAALRSEIRTLKGRADSIMVALYPAPPTRVGGEGETAVEVLPYEVGTEVGALQATDSLPAGDALPETDTLPATDTLSEPLPVPDSTALLSVPSASEPLSLPAPETVEPLVIEPEPSEPERPEPPEVTELRKRMAELTAEADSLSTAENYIRPRAAGVEAGGSEPDSLALLRLDSLARVDSLVRVDSIAAHLDSLRTHDPGAYKKASAEIRKAEKERLKAERRRLKYERQDEKYAAKEAKRAEKQRAREEKRAEKAAAKAEKLALRRRSVAIKRGRLAELLIADSLARADSLAVLDSLSALDSLAVVDSLHILDSLAMADSLLTVPEQPSSDTTMRIFRGWFNVKVWSRDMQAVADSMVGFSRDSTLHLYTDPVMWNGDSQITADSITMFTANETIERVEFFGDPIMGSQSGSDVAKQFNQVKGKAMTSWFRDGELYRHDANDAAQALYYMLEDENPDPIMFLVVEADNISFLFENDSLRYINARVNPKETAYPLDQIPPSQSTQLQGFSWQPERQPVLSDVFNRRVRPSERAFHEALSQPAFPIAARIDRRREYLMTNRMWADRTDPLPAYAEEFRREMLSK